MCSVLPVSCKFELRTRHWDEILLSVLLLLIFVFVVLAIVRWNDESIIFVSTLLIGDFCLTRMVISLAVRQICI